MKKIVSVIGGGSCPPEDERVARELGRLLAESGYIVLTGEDPPDPRLVDLDAVLPASLSTRNSQDRLAVRP